MNVVSERLEITGILYLARTDARAKRHQLQLSIDAQVPILSDSSVRCESGDYTIAGYKVRGCGTGRIELWVVLKQKSSDNGVSCKERSLVKLLRERRAATASTAVRITVSYGTAFSVNQAVATRNDPRTALGRIEEFQLVQDETKPPVFYVKARVGEAWYMERTLILR